LTYNWIGEVFLACDILTVQDVVIKLEPLNASQYLLEHEYQVYKKLSGGIGIPCICWFGAEGDFNAMVLDCLGQSLEALFACCLFKFTLQTVLVLTGQLVCLPSLQTNTGFAYLQFQLCCLKHIHSCNFIHRDLKPSNITMGTGMQSNVVYLIDFGLSKEYRDPMTYEHIPCNTNLGLTGTAKFASINSHLGWELGQQDNLESLAYLLIYFICGSLPWQDLPSEWSILKRKQRTTPSKLYCGLPAEFSTFLEYSRSLGFEEVPDYMYIINLFKGLSLWEGSENVVVFDWDRPKSADGQPRDRVSDCIGQCKRNQPLKRRQGYVMFLFWTSYTYAYVKLCLGCAPRHVNASKHSDFHLLLLTPWLPRFSSHLYKCELYLRMNLQ
jgi:serine/threonine protein kinase